MGHVEGFPDRDGLDKLIKLGKALCMLVATFSPILLRKYPDNPTIAALLAAIAGVCALIPEVEATFDLTYGDNTIPLEDPSSTPGLDNTRPAAPEGDIT
jgi:hypothetical protein